LDRHDNTERFEDLYGATYQDVLAYCRRRVPIDDADDVVSATYVVAWRRLDDVLSADSPIAWLYGVAYRVIGNHYRGSGRLASFRKKLRRLPPKRVVSPEDEVEISDEVGRALVALESLTPADQELIRLAVFEDLSRREIGAVVGLSPEAVASRLYRARTELRRAFDTDEGGPK
jgi:RNA polymerase sigma-70 factor (ECF subfamily)